MWVAYLFFVLAIFIIRMFAGYDSRYQNGKYLPIKNKVLSKILLGSMSIYTRNSKRLKKDQNKMSIRGIVLYIVAGTVLLINLIFLFVADIPIKPWVMKTDKFIIYVNTFNDKIECFNFCCIKRNWCSFPLACPRTRCIFRKFI